MNIWDDICTCGHKRKDHFQKRNTNHCLIQGCSCEFFVFALNDETPESNDSDGDLVPPLDGDDDADR